MKAAPPIESYLAFELRKYKFALPLLLSFAVGTGAGLRAISAKQSESIALLRAIAPHVSILLESNDRPDLQRLITSISNQLKVKIEILRAKQVLASTLSRERISTFAHDVRPYGMLPAVSAGYIVSETQVDGLSSTENTVTMRMLSPLAPVLQQIAMVVIATFAACFFAITILVSKISTVAKRTLRPVQDLDAAIHNLLEDASAEIAPFEVLELENIRESVQNVKRKLNIATDGLAEARAQKLAAEAMKRLMHDLHTPITALSQMMKISVMESMPEEYRSEARSKMVELAEQILRQVGNGKENFETRVHINVNADLSDTLRRTIERARLAMLTRTKDSELLLLTQSSICFSHDPELLERVITNLIMNAIEAEATSVKVVAEIEEGSPKIVVSDNGPGMTKADVALHLSGRGKSSKGNRTGMGLSNCNHIVRLHGGRIIHRASSSGGSEFEVRFKNLNAGGAL